MKTLGQIAYEARWAQNARVAPAPWALYDVPVRRNVEGARGLLDHDRLARVARIVKKLKPSNACGKFRKKWCRSRHSALDIRYAFGGIVGEKPRSPLLDVALAMAAVFAS